MRAAASLFLAAMALAMSGCTTEITKALFGPPPGPDMSPRVAAYYSPTDQRVIYEDAQQVTYQGPVTAP